MAEGPQTSTWPGNPNPQLWWQWVALKTPLDRSKIGGPGLQGLATGHPEHGFGH